MKIELILWTFLNMSSKYEKETDAIAATKHMYKHGIIFFPYHRRYNHTWKKRLWCELQYKSVTTGRSEKPNIHLNTHIFPGVSRCLLWWVENCTDYTPALPFCRLAPPRLFTLFLSFFYCSFCIYFCSFYFFLFLLSTHGHKHGHARTGTHNKREMNSIYLRRENKSFNSESIFSLLVI